MTIIIITFHQLSVSVVSYEVKYVSEEYMHCVVLQMYMNEEA